MAFRIVVPRLFLSGTYNGAGEKVCFVCFDARRASETWCALCGAHVHMQCLRMICVPVLNRTCACITCAEEYGQ